MPYILICGSLANTDIAVAELLSRYEISVRVIRFIKDKINSSDNMLAGDLKYFSLDKVVCVSDPQTALPYLKEAKLIISLTGAIDQFLSLRNIIFRNRSILPKTLNITTGADITELVRSPHLQGKKFRHLLKKSLFNFLNPYPEVIESLKKVNLKNFQIIKSPYYLLAEKKAKSKIALPGNEVHFFMPSNLDWGATDRAPGRNTTKGNNRFLNAFIRASKIKKNIKCTILDRGPDRGLARNIIEDSKCKGVFNILPGVTQSKLSKLITSAEIIVDQFDVGALGGIACEAMAQAKPVMTYVNKDCWPLVYGEEPPVINCHTEEEIYQAILEWTDPKKLQELGENGEKWVRKYHDIHTADFSEFILRVCLAAGLEWPRKDLTVLGK